MPMKNALSSWRTALTISIHGALGACTPFRPQGPTASAFDAIDLAGHDYVAFVEPRTAEERFGGFPPRMVERGHVACAPNGTLAHVPQCPPELRSLIEHLPSERSIVVIHGSGPPEVITDRALQLPIDSPEKALLAVWLSGRYRVEFSGR